MKTLGSLFFLWALLFSPILNAVNQHDMDKQRVVNITRTMDARAKHCHRVLNYLGGFNAAAELYRVLKGEESAHTMLLGSCVEFVTLTGKLTDLITSMEEKYGKRPTRPGIVYRANIVALMLYLESIEKQKAFVQTFSE